MINLWDKLALDKKKLPLIILVGLIIIYLDVTLFLKLQFYGIKSISLKNSKLTTDMHSLTKDLAVLEDLKNKQIRTGQKAPPKVKKIISEAEIPSLLQDIADIANKYQVKILKMAPSRDLKSKEEKISLDLVCAYHRFGSFLNDLENADKFMAVQDLKITPDMGNYFQQKINLTLKIYVKK